MTNQSLEQRIAEAVGSLTTDLPFARIAEAIPTAAPEPMPLPRRRYASLVAVAACVALVLALGGLWHHLSSSTNPDSDPPIVQPPVVMSSAVIDIDVNPSVEITVDTADRISAVTAVNTDAALLVSRLDLTQMSLQDGVKALFDAMVTHGYVANGSNPVLVTVQSGDAAEADRLHALVNSGVDAAMTQHSLSASVVNQTVTTFDEVAAFAQKHGISNGKAAFILQLAEQDPRLEAEKLTDHAFSVLAAIAQHQNVPLSELVDYDATDGLWEDIINALSAELTEAEHRWGSMLSVSEVKALALDALPSDYIAENALVVRMDFSWEEEPLYRIELVSLGYLYEYTIHASDGTFLKPTDSTTSTTTTADNGTIRSTLQGGGTRVPIDGSTQKPPKTTVTTIVTTTTTTAFVSNDAITPAEAETIVLSRMGLTVAEVRDVAVGQHYLTNEMSVRFIYENQIYCFYVNSTTGAVTKGVYLPLDIAIENYRLDEWDALDIAFAHANMSEEEYGEITIMYYVHNDAPFIDVVWLAHSTSYHYRIDGVDGSIASYSAIPLAPSITVG